jgi:hypothetical protein
MADHDLAIDEILGATERNETDFDHAGRGREGRQWLVILSVVKNLVRIRRRLRWDPTGFFTSFRMTIRGEACSN